MKRSILSGLFVLSSLSVFAADAAMDSPVNICDDESEWPPYIYFKRDEAGKIKNRTDLDGAAFDFFSKIFEKAGLKFTMTMLPWKQCLTQVKEFDPKKEGKKYEVFTNGSANKEREETYLMSLPVYRTHLGIFYNSNKHKDLKPGEGKELKNFVEGLNKGKLCGILGYNYDMFYQMGFKKEIDTGSKDTAATLQKIEKDRCDFMVTSLEPIYGGEKVKQYAIPTGIQGMALNGAETTSFHIWVSKNSPRGQELITKINAAITALQSDGTAKTIFTKYIPTGDGIAN